METSASNYSHNPLIIGYYDPFNTFLIIEKDLQSRFPLTNLHWKYDSSRPLKSIPKLDVTLKEYVPKKNSDLTDIVHLHLMCLKGDSIDVYRSLARPLIKEWLRNTVKKSEWMIILVVPSNAKIKGSHLMKSSIFDKIKNDFGIDGKELPKDIGNTSNNRFFKIKEDDESNFDNFGSIISQIKDNLLLSFTNQYLSLVVSLKDPETLTSDSKDTHLPAIQTRLKRNSTLVRLAELLKSMSLFEESLKYYSTLTLNIESLFLMEPNLFEFRIPSYFPNFLSFDSEKYDNIRSAIVNGSYLLLNIFNLFDLKIFIFTRRAILLQSLAENSTSSSIAASFVATLYQSAIIFLNDVYTNKGNDQNENILINEWCFKLAELFITLPVTWALLKKSQKYEESSHSQINNIFECMGELKLLQRTIFLDLGNSVKGYKLHGADLLEEIDLCLNESKDPIDIKVITDSNLKLALTTETLFYSFYQQKTESVMQDFIKAGRAKSIDLLSIDIALAKFFLQKYEETLQILEDSADFFITHGWNFMGGILLDIYLKCLELLLKDSCEFSTRKVHQILRTSLDLLSNMRVGGNGGCIGINNYGTLRGSNKFREIFDKVSKYSNLAQRDVDSVLPIEYSLSKLFDVSVSSFIGSEPSENSEDYFIDVEIFNPFGVDINFESMNVLLIGDSKTLVFKHDDFVINGLLDPLAKSIRLFTHDFVYGSFKLSEISMHVNKNLKFTTVLNILSPNMHSDGRQEEFSQKISHTNKSAEDINSNSSHLTPPTSYDLNMFCYPRLHNLWFEFLDPFECDLTEKEVLLRVHCNKKKLTDLLIHITSCTTGIDIRHLEIRLIDERVNFDQVDDDGTIRIGNLEVEHIDIIIPYNSSCDSKTIHFKGVIKYVLNKKKYSHASIYGIDTTLAVAVSVQDIFKIDHIISKFQIGLSSSKLPIKILSSILSSSSKMKLEVCNASAQFGPVVVYGDQPATFFYKIKNSIEQKMNATEDVLSLSIDYQSIKSDLLNFFLGYTLSRLKEINLETYWFLFKNEILPNISFDLNHFSLYDEIVILNKDDTNLLLNQIVDQYVRTRAEKAAIVSLFGSIFGYTTQVVQATTKKWEYKRLRIPVSLPYLRILHVLDVSFDKKNQFIVGEPIEVELKVIHSTKWQGKNEVEDNQNLTSETFQLIINSDENWLIGGFKRTVFGIDYAESFNKPLEVKLNLIPLHVGNLTFPKIEIKLLNYPSSTEVVPMDIVYKQGVPSILVVPELERITFSF